MITTITAVLGIISTLLAWFLNPKQAIYRELDSIYKQLEALYAKRDKALASNDSDGLAAFNADFIKLCDRKNALLQRLR